MTGLLRRKILTKGKTLGRLSVFLLAGVLAPGIFIGCTSGASAADGTLIAAPAK